MGRREAPHLDVHAGVDTPLSHTGVSYHADFGRSASTRLNNRTCWPTFLQDALAENSTRKTSRFPSTFRTIGIEGRKNFFYDICVRLDTIPQRDEQADRNGEMMRGKNAVGHSLYSLTRH